MIKHIFMCLLLTSLISACGPVYQTQYEMVPPRSEVGKMCANNCLMARTNCKQSCDIQINQCSRIEELRAENDYQSYLLRQSREGRPAKLEMHNFYHTSYCQSDRCETNCEETYQQCHTNCGGQVIPHTVCTAFCDAP